MMLTKEILNGYNMQTLDEYKAKHGDTLDTEYTFYQTFLIQTDYIVSKIMEYQYQGKEVHEEYQTILQCRDYCREQIRALEGRNT